MIPHGRNLKVLLLDESDSHSRVLESTLNSLGWNSDVDRLSQFDPSKATREKSWDIVCCGLSSSENALLQFRNEIRTLWPYLFIIELDFDDPGKGLMVRGTHPANLDWQDVGRDFGAILEAVLFEQAHQLALQNAEELRRIKAAIEFASDCICVTDAEGRSIFQNHAFTNLLGTTESLNSSGGIRGIFTHRSVADDTLNSIEGSGFWAGIAFVRTVDGEAAEFFVRANKARDPNGNAWATIFVGTDVREERKSQRKLAEQAALLDHAQDAILVQDLHGYVTYWNMGAQRLFGWNSSQVRHERVQDLIHKDTTSYDIALHRTLRDGQWSGDLRNLAMNEREVLVQSRWTLLRDEFGDPKSILVINTDITDKKKLETQFFRTQRLESIGTLAGGIAHDLNNVLGPIIMAVDLFRLKLTDPADLELLETVAASAKHGAEMVHQVLSFARGVEGQRTVVQPTNLLREIAKIAGETFPKSVTVHVNEGENLRNVPGDPTQLHQVLLNLAVNARDAMPKGGEITLTAANIDIDAHFAGMHPDAHAGRFVVLRVTDTGTGMRPEVQEKVFEPFFTTKDVGRGTGLGLSTVLSIVRSHRGFITVDSRLGSGTTFKVYLPADDDDSVADSHMEPEDLPRGDGELILVIDDEASVRTITKQTLEAFGYRVLTASDGAEGVATYARNMKDVSVVLTDMMMPVMDGAATIRALQRLNANVKIVAASGLASKGSEADSANLGSVCCFLPKPYTASTMLRTFAAILQAGRIAL